jgi:hypothetical protein
LIDSDSEMEVDEVAEDDDEESIEEEEGEQREWDENCYICNKKGKLMCCETCSNVCHLTCTGLKKEPQGEWHCEECLIKQS